MDLRIFKTVPINICITHKAQKSTTIKTHVFITSEYFLFPKRDLQMGPKVRAAGSDRKLETGWSLLWTLCTQPNRHVMN